MSSHICPGDDCARCRRLIEDREFGDDSSPTGWQGGQDAYERQLDRQGGSA